MTDVLLQLDDVTAGYPRRPVLQGVQIALKRGSFTGLVGANGTGKTTLIKTILGILPPLSGNVHLRETEGRRAVLGYVPQREAFDPVYLFSAAEVVAMGVQGRVKPGRSPGSGERDFVRHCLEQCEADGFAGRRFSELSGGQKQRTLIARALAARPDLLLLDEPTAGIDTAASAGISALLRKLHADGMTILMVNHELDVVRELAEQVIWLRHGQIVQGSVAELLTVERASELIELKLG